MTSSGTAGFFADNVVNLDGKVNFEALKARRNNELGKYCIQDNINLIADWKENAQLIIKQAEQTGAQFEQIGSIGPIELHKRIR